MIKQFYFAHRWDLNRFYYPGMCGPGSNDNEDVLHIPQSLRTEASPSDVV